MKNAPESWTEIVRRGYLSGLKETLKAESIPIILDYVKPGHNDYLRRTAPGLLADLGKKHKKKYPNIKDVIEGLLYDRSYRVQIAAINAARGYDSSDLIPSLQKLAEGHVDSGIVRPLRSSPFRSQSRNLRERTRTSRIDCQKWKPCLRKMNR